jgi:amidohydrolase
VQEMVDSDHKSTVEGKSHTCGHDGHSAMLLGAAQYLARTRAFNGTVNLIFQPAEEIMGGAVAMIEDGLFERFPMDAVFGMHNMPGLERGKLYFTAGPIMAAVDNWEIVLTGKGSHGSMPEKSIDPVVAGASLVMALQTIVSRNVGAKDSAVVSVGAFLAGDAGNVIPQTATLRLSIRSSAPETRKLVLEKVKAITAAQALSFGVSHEIREGAPGAVLVNDPTNARVCGGRSCAARRGPGGDARPHLHGQRGLCLLRAEEAGHLLLHRQWRHADGASPDVRLRRPQSAIGAAWWVAVAEHFLN